MCVRGSPYEEVGEVERAILTISGVLSVRFEEPVQIAMTQSRRH